MATRYNSNVWKNRPSILIWNELKRWVGYQPGQDISLPPEFGYICDILRNNYGIYVSVTPHMQTVTEDNGDIVDSLVFHFGGEVVVMEKIGVPTDSITYTGSSYDNVMLNCLTWVGKYLNSK